MTDFPGLADLAGHMFDDVDGTGLSHPEWMALVGTILESLLQGGSGGTTVQAWRSLAAAPDGGLWNVAASSTAIYAIGGQSGSDPPADLFRYNLDSDTWTTLAGPGIQRQHMQAGLLAHANNKLYLFVQDHSDFSGKTFIYDIVGESWTIGTAWPSPASDIMGCATSTDAYLIGGVLDPGTGVCTADAYKYHFGTDTWTAIAPLDSPSSYGMATVASDGTIYVFLGVNNPNTGNVVAEAHIYDPIADAWDTGSPVYADNQPFAQTVAAIGTIDGKIVVAGGDIMPTHTSFNFSVHASLGWSYDPATSIYSPLADLPFSGESHGAVLDGKLYVLGGLRGFAVLEPKSLVDVRDIPAPLHVWAKTQPGSVFVSDTEGVVGVGETGVRGVGHARGVYGVGAGEGGVRGHGNGDFTYGVYGTATGANTVGVLAGTLGVENAANHSFEIFDSNGDSLGFVSINPGAGSSIASAFPYASIDITVPFESIPISYKWMAFPEDEPVIAYGLAGDSYPRVCLLADPIDGWYFGDGTFDPYNDGGPTWAILADAFTRGFFFNSGHNDAVPNYGQIRVEAGVPGVAAKFGINGSIDARRGSGPSLNNFIQGATTFNVDEDPTTKSTVTITAAFEQTTPLLDVKDENEVTVGRVTPNGTPIFNAHTAPADAALHNSDFAFWLDDTPGSTALKIKAKNSAGEVVTATVPLS